MRVSRPSAGFWVILGPKLLKGGWFSSFEGVSGVAKKGFSCHFWLLFRAKFEGERLLGTQRGPKGALLLKLGSNLRERSPFGPLMGLRGLSPSN